jgi:ABC-type glycerol-3-phosphate transport system permease component
LKSRTSRRPSRARDRRAAAAVRHAALAFASVCVVLPIFFAVVASFKDQAEFFANPFGLPETWRWENYAHAWTEAKVSVTLPNSVIVTTLSVIFSTALSGLAAYGVSRREKPLAFALYALFVSGMLVPV